MKRLRTPFLAFGVLYAICSMFEDVFLVYFNARYFARISGGFSLNCSHPLCRFNPLPSHFLLPSYLFLFFPSVGEYLKYMYLKYVFEIQYMYFVSVFQIHCSVSILYLYFKYISQVSVFENIVIKYKDTIQNCQSNKNSSSFSMNLMTEFIIPETIG